MGVSKIKACAYAKKICNLIDISKKDPKAIAQLIKESGIDPLDIDTDEIKLTSSLEIFHFDKETIEHQ